MIIDLPRSHWNERPPLVVRLRLILLALLAAVLVRADLVRLGWVASFTAVFVIADELRAWLAHLPAALTFRIVDYLTPNVGRVALC